MKGQEKIIEMRKAGMRPAIVFVNDFPDESARSWHNPGERYGEVWPADHPTVCTHATPLSSVDMRFAVGMRVSISADSEQRAKALFKKAVEAGASCVAASHAIPAANGRFTSGWTEIYHAKEVAHG